LAIYLGRQPESALLRMTKYNLRCLQAMLRMFGFHHLLHAAHLTRSPVPSPNHQTTAHQFQPKFPLKESLLICT